MNIACVHALESPARILHLVIGDAINTNENAMKRVLFFHLRGTLQKPMLQVFSLEVRQPPIQFSGGGSRLRFFVLEARSE